MVDVNGDSKLANIERLTFLNRVVNSREQPRAWWGLANRSKSEYSKDMMIEEELLAVREEKILRKLLMQRGELIQQQSSCLEA